MAKSSIAIHVKMDGRTFRRFAFYDTFVKNKRWKSPATFALLMTAFAAACFLFHHKEGAVMLGVVLLSVGLGMPVVYGLSFLMSVSASIKAQKLPRPASEVILSNQAEGIFIRSLADGRNEHLTLRWDSLHAVHRAKGCIYLYAIPTKAFLLPDGQADASPNEVWAMITRNLDQSKK